MKFKTSYQYAKPCKCVNLLKKPGANLEKEMSPDYLNLAITMTIPIEKSQIMQLLLTKT